MNAMDEHDVMIHPHPVLSPGPGRWLWLTAVGIRASLPAGVLAWVGLMVGVALHPGGPLVSSSSTAVSDRFVAIGAIGAVALIGLHLVAPRLYGAAYDRGEHLERCVTGDCIGVLRWWEGWLEHLVSRAAVVVVAVSLSLWSHPGIGVVLSWAAGLLAANAMVVLVVEAVWPPPHLAWSRALAMHAIDLVALAILVVLGSTAAFWSGLAVGVVVAPVCVALCAASDTLLSRGVGIRRPTIPQASAGAIHSVNGRQHALDMLARLTPRLVSWFAPNAPATLCGGTLITDALDPDDHTSNLPRCPDCAAVAVTERPTS